MAVKILKKSSESLNTLIFMVLSLPFIHIIKSLHVGESAINWLALKTLVLESPFIGLVVTFVALLIFRGKRASTYLAPLVILFFFSWSISYFFNDWNKHILFLSFIYLIVGFYMCLLWNSELGRPVYKPGFHEKTIGSKSEYQLQGTLVDKNDKRIPFYITNWGERSCFLVPETNEKLRGRVRLFFHFGKKEFIAEGTVISTNSLGYGISMKDQDKMTQTLGWDDYYAIISDRGYFSRFV
jgi:hypothetical protein